MADEPRPGEAALDAWSVAHVAAGAALGVVGAPFAWAAAILIAFEVFEATLRAKSPSGGKGLFEHESKNNILADVAVGLGGYLAVKSLRGD